MWTDDTSFFFWWLKAIHCVGCAYSEGRVIISMVVRLKIGVTKCDPAYVQELSSMTTCTFNLINPQEEVRIGTTALIGEYPIKYNSSFSIPRCFIENSLLKSSVTRWIQLRWIQLRWIQLRWIQLRWIQLRWIQFKITTFYHCIFSVSE